MDLQKAWKEQPLTIGLLVVGAIIAVLLGVIAFKGSPPPPTPPAQPTFSGFRGFRGFSKSDDPAIWKLERQVRDLQDDARRNALREGKVYVNGKTY